MRILGVRHHSPACAGLVKRVIEEVRPAWVLIEGPADFNPRLDELALDHQLPIAIFSYNRGQACQTASLTGGPACRPRAACQACWTPFCDYSPEWVALRAARDVGASALFMDLPGWSFVFEEKENRFSDRHAPDLTRMAQRLGFDDTDRMWDSLFEQPRDDLEEALRVYFRELRASLGEVASEDSAREAFMASSLAWAQRQGGEVVVVCGGYHAPYLEHAWSQAEAREPRWEGGGEVGNFLVPFTFQRLDSFAGYQSGMPSPAYHQRVWESGLESAARQSLRDVAQRLRARKQSASSADLVVALSMAVGLARLRGHRQMARTDVLDGLASALLSGALEVELPWSRRGTLQAGNDPVLVEIVAAFSGQRRGALHPDTPRPPLVTDVTTTLERLDLTPRSPAREVKLHALSDRERSSCLHRLALLAIPGFQRLSGGKIATRGGLDEVWRIRDVFERESALIEASHWGPDLETACTRYLEQALAEAEGAAVVAQLLCQALFANLEAFSEKAMPAISAALARESSLAELGEAMSVILELYAHDLLLGGRGKQELGGALEAGFQRGLWLFEGMLADEPGALVGLEALRNTHRRSELDLPRELAVGLMTRAAAEAERHPALQGGAVGYLWSTVGGAGGERALAHLARLLPTEAADFLVGLLVLAREQVLEDVPLVRGLDSQVRQWGHSDFLAALPALRLAFAILPPADKQRLGELIATLYGRTLSRDWYRLEVPAEVVARGMELEEKLDLILQERGLS